MADSGRRIYDKKKTKQANSTQQVQQEALQSFPASFPERAGSSSGIPVVGMGGSSGSLGAFKTFFTTMPADSGAAFVVIQHLAPTHQSLLAEILAHSIRA